MTTFGQTLQTAPLNDIVKLVNNSLDKAEKDLVDSKVKIDKAVIKLETAQDFTAGGGFKIIIKAGADYSRERATRMTFEYTTPPAIENKDVGVKPRKFEKKLVKAIKEAAKQWKGAKDIDGLVASSFTVDLAFTVKLEGELGVEFEVWGVGVDLGGEGSKSAVHTISLSFKPI